MSEEYDLKKSKETIGQLYPILEAKDGEIIDGFHREQVDKGWKRIRLEHIDTEEKKIIARLVANFHRRQITAEEKAKWINGLAEIYKKQGFKISEKVGSAHATNPLRDKIMEVTGLSKNTVNEYLSKEYKQTLKGGWEEESPRKPASQVIVGKLGEDYGKQLVERHREEVLTQETPKIREQVKRELIKSPEFQREVIREISKPQIVKASEPCPSGVCELPSRIESSKPIDIMAERLAKFWEDNPECLCKKCKHYDECGVIR